MTSGPPAPGDGGRARRRSRATPTLLLVGVLATSLVVGGLALAGPASAAATPRTAVSGRPPVQVFQGETVDVTGVNLTGGGTIGAGSVTFVGLAGDADGTVESGDASSIDFTDWATGTYDADGDGKADVVVTTPRVTDVTLHLANGADVTNRSSPADLTMTLTTTFNFGAADGVEINVTDADGLDVAPTVASSTHVDSSGGSVTLDFSRVDPGAYTITVEARNLEATRTVTVGIDTTTTFLSVPNGSLTQGAPLRVTVHGDPGATYLVRIPTSDLDGLGPTDAAAQQVFDPTGAVVTRAGSASQDVVYATVKLDDSGRGDVVVRTEHLRTDNTASIELGRGSDPSASTIDTVTIAVGTGTQTPTATPTATPTPTSTTSTPVPTTTAETTTSPSATTVAPTSTATPTGTAPATTTTTTGGQPGFGLVVGLVGAVLAAVLALRRRR